MAEQTLKEKTAKGLFWGGISNGAQQILGLIFGIVLARILSPEDYGMVGMLAIFTGIASTIQESGFTAALVNKPEIKHEDYNAVFWFSLLIGVVLYVILFFCAPLIAWFYEKPELTNLSRLVFLGFLFGGAGIAHNAILFKNLMVKEKAKIDVTALIVSGTVGLVMALNGFAYWGLAVQSTIYIVVGTLLRWYFSPWRPTFQFNIQPLKEMFGFSFKLFLTNIFQQISANAFSVLLGKFYNATQLGYFSQSNKWMGMGNQLIAGMISSVVQPVIIQVKNNKERQLNVFRKMMRFASFVAFPAFLGLAFISKEFISITIGTKWMPSVLILQILCVWGIVSPFVILFTQLLISHGKSNIYLWGNIITGFFQLIIPVVIYFLGLGIIYMVVGYVISYFCSLFYWFYCSKNLIGLSFVHVLKDVTPYLFVAVFSLLIASIATVFVENMFLLIIVKIFVTIIVYVSLLWMCNSRILKESIQLIKNSK